MDIVKKYKMSESSSKEPKRIRLLPIKSFDDERVQKESKKHPSA